MSRTSFHPVRTIGYLFAATMAVACDHEPAGPAAPASLEISQVANLEQASAKAALAGDAANATVLAGAATAISHGVQPSDILVSVKGNVTRYRAIVVGTVETLSLGDTAIRRSLVAWAGDDRTIATLDVSTLGDVGSFSSEFEPASDPRSRASGLWVDLVRDSRWKATTGTAQISIMQTGRACHTAQFGDVRCVFATYNVFVDGLFRLWGASPDAQLPAVRIYTNARVNGVLISNGSIATRQSVGALRSEEDSRREGAITRRTPVITRRDTSDMRRALPECRRIDALTRRDLNCREVDRKRGR